MTLEDLRDRVSRHDHTVAYYVKSTIVVSVSQADVDNFLESDWPRNASNDADLERQFWAWCIAGDGYDFDERDASLIDSVHFP